MTTQSQPSPRGGSGEMFNRIAGRYDLLNRIISLGIDQRWRKKAVESLAPSSPRAILDLATGTGDIAIACARRYTDATVVGVDPSTGMLAVGRDKVSREGLSGRVRLGEGSAEALSLDDESFDGITMAFGIRNVPDRPRALAEMRRVLRPGGRVAILELSEPRSGLLSPLARLHVHHVVPALGGLLSGSREYRYLQASIAEFPAPEEFGRLMGEAGLEVLSIEPLTFGVACLYVATR